MCGQTLSCFRDRGSKDQEPDMCVAGRENMEYSRAGVWCVFIAVTPFF